MRREPFTRLNFHAYRRQRPLSRQKRAARLAAKGHKELDLRRVLSDQLIKVMH